MYKLKSYDSFANLSRRSSNLKKYYARAKKLLRKNDLEQNSPVIKNFINEDVNSNSLPMRGNIVEVYLNERAEFVNL